MKTGDKVKCIKNHIIGNTTILIKDRVYTIIKFGIDTNSENIKFEYITTTSDNGNKNWCSQDKGPYYKFSEYLQSTQEERKQKLLKINKYNEQVNNT